VAGRRLTGVFDGLRRGSLLGHFAPSAQFRHRNLRYRLSLRTEPWAVEILGF